MFVNFFVKIFFLSGPSIMNFRDSQGSKVGGRLPLLTFLYYFHTLHKHLDISRTITAESSPLHITSSRTWTDNRRFPSVIR